MPESLLKEYNETVDKYNDYIKKSNLENDLRTYYLEQLNILSDKINLLSDELLAYF